MSILNNLSSSKGKRDNKANIKLAKEVVEKKDRKGIKEIYRNLRNENKKVRIDCINILAEIGKNDPSLIDQYVDEFLRLLESKDNHMVWESMEVLTTIADLRPGEIFKNLSTVYEVIDKGSVITRDYGIKVLSIVASKDKKYNKEIFPYLVKHLNSTRAKDLPQHTESILVAVNKGNKDEFIGVLNKRIAELTDRQSKRVEKVLDNVDEL